MRLLLALLVVLPASLAAYTTASWVDDLDTIRADLLSRAKLLLGPAETAEDMEPHFATACEEISEAGCAVAVHYYQSEAANKFQLCVAVNRDDLTLASEIISCWTLTRTEIEE